MKKKKLISVRIDTDILKKLDQYVAYERYWSRSAVINNILEAVIERTDPNDFDMFAKFPTFTDKFRKISLDNWSM